LEGRRVGAGEHVRLIDAGEAFDARAVEAHALFEGLLQFFHRDGEALERADDVREPEADELHIVLPAPRPVTG
jgi:hypothetical protein